MLQSVATFVFNLTQTHILVELNLFPTKIRLKIVSFNICVLYNICPMQHLTLKNTFQLYFHNFVIF